MSTHTAFASPRASRPAARHLSSLIAVLLSLVVLPSLTGCASQQMLKDYEDRVVQLQEDKTGLSKQNLQLKGEVARLEAELGDMANFGATAASSPLADPVHEGLEAYDIDVSNRPGGMTVISIPSSITFPSGSADLSTNGKNAVREVARVLDGSYGGMTYWIEGHTDNDQPTKSKFASNRELSLARAMNVLRFLVDQCDIPDSQCVTVGHGEYEPLVANSSPANKATNRRVEIVIHPN